MNFVKELSRWYSKFHKTDWIVLDIQNMCYKVSGSPIQIKQIQLVPFASFDLLIQVVRLIFINMIDVITVPL